MSTPGTRAEGSGKVSAEAAFQLREQPVIWERQAFLLSEQLSFLLLADPVAVK